MFIDILAIVFVFYVFISFGKSRIKMKRNGESSCIGCSSCKNNICEKQ